MNVVVAAALGQRAGVGGHAWVPLQYLLGFRRLGHDVLFVDQIADARKAPEQVAWVRDVLGRFGLDDVSILLPGGEVVGTSRPELIARMHDSVLLNVMGFLDDEEVLGAAGTRVFLDIDPGFGQMWRELGLADIFGDHDSYVTVGANVGRSGCGVPTCGIPWRTTRPPVVLERWPCRPPRPDAPITAIASWRGPFGPIDFRGHTYGLRVHEFRKFLELPGRTGERFELALDIGPEETPDLERLASEEWRLVHPRTVAGDPDRYQSYIERSKAEIMVAKNLYVDTRSGWFSDRSACYLASGRPVIAQDTGWSDRLPSGKGLLSFSRLDEAVEATRLVDLDYEDHCRAARAVAEEHFDSDVVLTQLLSHVGAS